MRIYNHEIEAKMTVNEHDTKPLIGPNGHKSEIYKEKIASDHDTKPLIGPSGRKIVYDKDGKPCRTCNSLLDFRAVTHQKMAAGVPVATSVGSTALGTAAPAVSQEPKECPPDVNELGKSSWTLLHSIAATYPASPSKEQQEDITNFIGIFSRIYPCWFCAEDFQKYTAKNKPKVQTQEEFGRWLCDAHNEVNVKLGKPKFDCNLWKQRWKDGWEDGSCD